jgi:RNA polymerase sigma-70 factor (ECF subfamily)
MMERNLGVDGRQGIAMHEQEFAAVLGRARQGDPAAMARLVEEYEPQIRRVAHRRLGPGLRATLDSTDLVQSVHRSLLLCLRKNKFTFAGPQDLVALAVTMVKRKAARKSARLQRERDFVQLRGLLLSRADPQRAAALAGELQDLLEGLDDADRELLRLYFEGHSTVEAARILGLQPDSLRVRRSRLFRKLRAAGLNMD